MNILAIDAGNTRIKWGLADDSGWLQRAVLDTADAAQLSEALRELPAPQRIVVSNVAGTRVRESLMQALANYRVTPLWVQGRAQQCGVRSSYADPAQLGPDRWAGLIAAWKHSARAGRACVVVNAGTTMTVDALTSEGVFLGGMIVPGIDLMRASLDRGTAQLKLQPGEFRYFPDNTADAIMSGAVNALSGAVERLCRYLGQASVQTEGSDQGPPLVMLSGGAAPMIQPWLNLDSATAAAVELVDNLVLEGLLEIAKDHT